MSEAKTYLKKVAKTCMGNDGKVTKVVEYADAEAALLIQKMCITAFFRDLFLEQAISIILGRNWDWSKYIKVHYDEI